MHAVTLIDPKFPHNVGGALRACSIFGAKSLSWTGDHVPAPEDWPEGARLPREERMKLYQRVRFDHGRNGDVLEPYLLRDYTPVAVELRDGSELLPEFVHPENAVYVFGPEDGNIPRGILAVCHRFVRIPTESCLNLSATVNVVLYDRMSKSGEWFLG